MHRFSLQKYSGSNSRFTCPQCSKQQQFSRYIDNTTGTQLADHVGKCNRVGSCGYHYTPKEYFKATGYVPKTYTVNNLITAPPKHIQYIPQDLVQKTLISPGCLHSNLARYLLKTLGPKISHSMFIYEVGRSIEDDGRAVIYWQKDIHGRYRTGKIMFYDPVSGKRRKDQGYTPKWVHKSKLLTQPFNFQQCFFGEHLLKDVRRRIAIVESEKSVLIASHFLPEYIWLSSGGVNGVKWQDYSVIKVLHRRHVTLFPDFGFYDKQKGITCFQKWQENAKHINDSIQCRINVSRVLEDQLHESVREKGFDIADFLITNQR